MQNIGVMTVSIRLDKPPDHELCCVSVLIGDAAVFLHGSLEAVDNFAERIKQNTETERRRLSEIGQSEMPPPTHEATIAADEEVIF